MHLDAGIPLGTEHPHDLLRGVFVDFEIEPPAGAQQLLPGPGDGAVESDPVVVRDEEGQRRLVVADIGMHGGPVAFGNVGRVGDQQVERSVEPLREVVQRIGPAERHPGTECPGILPGYGEGFGLYLENRPGGAGASVTATLPLRYEEDDQTC